MKPWNSDYTLDLRFMYVYLQFRKKNSSSKSPIEIILFSLLLGKFKDACIGHVQSCKGHGKEARILRTIVIQHRYIYHRHEANTDVCLISFY